MKKNESKSLSSDKPKPPEPLVFERIPCRLCNGERATRPSGVLSLMRHALIGDVFCGYCDDGEILHVHDKIGKAKEPVEFRVWITSDSGVIARRFYKKNKRWPTWNEIEAIERAEEARFNRRFPNNHKHEPHHHHKQPAQAASQ